MTTELSSEVTQDELQEQGMSETQILKQRADIMGIKYPMNASAEKMKQLIDDHIARVETKQAARTGLRTNSSDDKVQHLRDEALKMVRIRLHVNDPSMQQRSGLTVCFNNAITGNRKFFIPLDPAFYTNGYHMENCIVEHLKNMKYSVHDQNKVKKNRNVKNHLTARFLPCFSIEYLEPLTEEELKQLAEEQAVNRSFEDD